MIETVSMIVAGVLSGIAAHKAGKAQKQTMPNGTDRTLIDLYEDLDEKLDGIVAWQAQHDARHVYLNPNDPWRPRSADE